MRNTNIDKVREQSIILARAVPIQQTSFGLIQHPFTNISMFPITVDNKTIFLNLLEDEGREKFFKELKETIDKYDLLRIYMMLNTPWKLTWLKFVEKYLSEKDFAEFFADAWISSENPNQDCNVSLNQSIKWFSKYPKENLMEPEDLKHWEEIPEVITLYRGVGKHRNPYGLSYTASKEKADWFQNRFYKGEGFLITLEVKKEDILVYFNTRGEDEYVVNTGKYRNEIKSQIIK